MTEKVKFLLTHKEIWAWKREIPVKTQGNAWKMEIPVEHKEIGPEKEKLPWNIRKFGPGKVKFLWNTGRDVKSHIPNTAGTCKVTALGQSISPKSWPSSIPASEEPGTEGFSPFQGSPWPCSSCPTPLDVSCSSPGPGLEGRSSLEQ